MCGFSWKVHVHVQRAATGHIPMLWWWVDKNYLCWFLRPCAWHTWLLGPAFQVKLHKKLFYSYCCNLRTIVFIRCLVCVGRCFMSQKPCYWCLRSTLRFRVTFMSSTMTLERKYRNSSTVYCHIRTHQIRCDMMILNMADLNGMPKQETCLKLFFLSSSGLWLLEIVCCN